MFKPVIRQVLDVLEIGNCRLETGTVGTFGFKARRWNGESMRATMWTIYRTQMEFYHVSEYRWQFDDLVTTCHSL